jgi:hypothetical protein
MCPAPRILALVLVLWPAAVLAADPGDGRLREALRTTTAQLRALEEDQARWQVKESQYQKELAALRAELEEARKGAASKGEGRALKQRLAQQAEASARAGEALAQCQKEAAAEAARAKDREEERAGLTGRLDGLASRVAGCEAKNARLIAAGQEFLRWIARPGMLCEPVLGLRRVALENKAQELEDKLLDHRATQEARPRGREGGQDGS